jgi:hypothetical protein
MGTNLKFIRTLLAYLNQPQWPGWYRPGCQAIGKALARGLRVVHDLG